jgi:hypothetical protein
VRWGERVTPKDLSDAQLPPCGSSALDMVRSLMARRDSAPGQGR